MKTERIVKELEGITEQLGVRVRREAGRFRGGRCVVHGQPCVLLNKQHPAEVQVAVLAQCLRTLPVDTVFMRPSVRAALEAAWAEQGRETPTLTFDDA